MSWTHEAVTEDQLSLGDLWHHRYTGDPCTERAPTTIYLYIFPKHPKYDGFASLRIGGEHEHGRLVHTFAADNLCRITLKGEVE
jgi:hypothetical protein